MSSSIQRIQSANIAGQARTPRFIQDQLRKLHDALAKNSKQICQAIVNDSSHTTAEAGVEFFLALTSVKEQYDGVDFHKELGEEYNIANEKDAASRKVPAGIVYIIPSQYTLFYSLIAPLSAAIAAGNCVIAELETTLSEVSSLLQKILPKALDTDTFAILETRTDNTEFFNSCTQVWGAEVFQQRTPSFKQIISPSNSRVVAVVDRSADLESAASALVRARFGFAGRSPYGPDLVLVNEFVLDEFRNMVAEHTAKAFARNSVTNGIARQIEKRSSRSSIIAAEEEGNNVVVSGTNGTVMSVQKRTSPLLLRKLNEPLLLIHSISSLDDAIDFANKGNKPLLATYLFATPRSAKYLSQFIDSHLSLINQVPIELLVGPASPLHPSLPATLSPSTRYPKALFQLPSPAYIHPTALSPLLTSALSSSPSTAISIKELEKHALAPLKPSDQRRGGQIGFFEQGIITGLVTIILPTVVGVMGLTFVAGREVVRRIN
jgi:acyl-CoA reductase-like NAD-dependent aldehyde dehydrogenase